MKLHPLGSIAALMMAGSAVHAQIIANGGFESPDLATYLSVNAGDSALAPWVVGLTAVDLADVNNGFLFAAAYEGSQYVDLDGSPGPGSLTQVFATTPGQDYELIFAYANNYASEPLSQASVRVFDGTGNLLSQTITHSSSVSGNLDWTIFSAQFTALESSASLEFATVGGTSAFGGILLDAVAVNAVPEPASLALLAMGAVLTAGRRRSR